MSLIIDSRPTPISSSLPSSIIITIPLDTTIVDTSLSCLALQVYLCLDEFEVLTHQTPTFFCIYRYSIMSFIHCSPLFVPLMPLPIMPPEVMRKERKKSAASTANPDIGVMRPSKERKTSSASTKAQGKQSATSSRLVPQSSSYSPTFAGPSHVHGSQLPFISPHSTTVFDSASMTQHLVSDHDLDSGLEFSYPENVEEGVPPLSHCSSYQEDNSAALTFTIESQPMDDLSSSQKLNDGRS